MEYLEVCASSNIFLLILWNHETFIELESASLINMKTVDLRVTFGQPPLDMRDSLIIALSHNDFPSQYLGESHIIQSRVRRYSNTGFFPSDADNR
jgi:hypothetical protein